MQSGAQPGSEGDVESFVALYRYSDTGTDRSFLPPSLSVFTFNVSPSCPFSSQAIQNPLPPFSVLMLNSDKKPKKSTNAHTFTTPK